MKSGVGWQKNLPKNSKQRLRDRRVTEKIIKLDYERNYPVIQKIPIIFEHPPTILAKRISLFYINVIRV